jgi:Ser/Thr protein kinase RdoA (MazF antagonist)
MFEEMKDSDESTDFSELMSEDDENYLFSESDTETRKKINKHREKRKRIKKELEKEEVYFQY